MFNRFSLRHSRRGTLNASSVGFGLAVGGAILALAALVGIMFIPAATFPTIDAELSAFLGAVLLVSGIVCHAAN